VLKTRKHGCLGTAVGGMQEVKANEKGGCGMRDERLWAIE
jgi:hypothetical protein